MIHNDATLAPGTFWAIVIAGIFLLIALLLVPAGIWLIRANDDYDDFAAPSFVFGALSLIIGLFVLGVGTFPWTAEYNTYRTVDGTVANINNRYLADGNGGTQQYYTIHYTTGQTFKCDDGRCGQATTGAYLKLSCIREFQFVGTSGWSCAYLDSRPVTK